MMNSELKISLNTEENVQTTNLCSHFIVVLVQAINLFIKKKPIALAQGLAKQGFGLVYGGGQHWTDGTSGRCHD